MSINITPSVFREKRCSDSSVILLVSTCPLIVQGLKQRKPYYSTNYSQKWHSCGRIIYPVSLNRRYKLQLLICPTIPGTVSTWWQEMAPSLKLPWLYPLQLRFRDSWVIIYSFTVTFTVFVHLRRAFVVNSVYFGYIYINNHRFELPI